MEVTMSVTTRGMLTEFQSGPHHHTSTLQRIGELVSTWRRRSQERQAFARLNERDLHDIGLSRWEVESELAKPFWRG
jgi:uncharacterized protein YjiS (DUF1127 family)